MKVQKKKSIIWLKIINQMINNPFLYKKTWPISIQITKIETFYCWFAGILQEINKNKITFNELNELLNQNNNNIQFTQEKWYKSLVEGTINIKSTPYILKATENKRNLIFENNKLVGTSSIELINGNKINIK